MEEIEKTRLIILKQLKSKCPFVIWDVSHLSPFWNKDYYSDVIGATYMSFVVYAKCNSLNERCVLSFYLNRSKSWEKYNKKEISRHTSELIKTLKKKVKQ